MRFILATLIALCASSLAAQEEEGLEFDLADVIDDWSEEDRAEIDAELDALVTQMEEGEITFGEFTDRISDEAYAVWLRDGNDPEDFVQNRPNACRDGRDFVIMALGGDLAGDDWRINKLGGATTVLGVVVPDDFMPPELPARLVPTRRGWNFYPGGRKVPMRMTWATAETHDLQDLVATGFADASGGAQEIGTLLECELPGMATLVGTYEDDSGRVDTIVLWIDSPTLAYGISMSVVGPATSVQRFQMSR